MEIVFITTNKNKVKEITDLAAAEAKDITIEHLDYDYPELQLDEIESVARESANYIREKRAIKKPFFLEDSGLLIHALKGFPGPFSAFVFDTIGNEGILKLMTDKRGEERLILYLNSSSSQTLSFFNAFPLCENAFFSSVVISPNVLSEPIG